MKTNLVKEFKFDYSKFIKNFFSNPRIREEMEHNKRIMNNPKIIEINKEIEKCNEKRRNLDSVKVHRVFQSIFAASSIIGIIGLFVNPINSLVSNIFGVVGLSSLTMFFGSTILFQTKQMKKGGKSYLKKLYLIDEKETSLYYELANEMTNVSKVAKEVYQDRLSHEYKKQTEKEIENKTVKFDYDNKKYVISRTKEDKRQDLKKYLDSLNKHKEKDDEFIF